MTRHALWMVIYLLFEWSSGAWGGKCNGQQNLDSALGAFLSSVLK